MTLRQMTDQDIAPVTQLLLRARCELHPEMPRDIGQVAQTVRRVAEETGAFGVVLDDGDGIFGVALAEVAQGPWVRGAMAVCHRYVVPSRRGRWGEALLRAFEDWAVGAGVTLVCLGHTDPSGRPRPGYYRRRGYAPAEQMFVKVL